MSAIISAAGAPRSTRLLRNPAYRLIQDDNGHPHPIQRTAAWLVCCLDGGA